MKYTFLIFLLYLLLLPKLTLARDHFPISLTPEDKAIYENTYAACKNNNFFNNQSYETFINSSNQVLSVINRTLAGNENAFITYKNTNSVTPELKRWIDSYGFIFALDDCFGKDQKLKDYYVMSLIFVWDLFPRFAGIILSGRLLIKSRLAQWYLLLLATMKIKGSSVQAGGLSDSNNIIGQLNKTYTLQEMFLTEQVEEAKKNGITEKVNNLEKALSEIRSLKVTTP
jgi:hypothetical protein